MADVFISYARDDQALAERLATEIKDHGWSVWWDHDIVAGHQFSEVIDRELQLAKAVVVIWSASSVTSQWVRDEAAEAQQRDALIPMCIGDVRPPLGLRGIQSIVIDTHRADGVSLAFRECVDAIVAMLGTIRVPPLRTSDDALVHIRKNVLAAQTRYDLQRQAAEIQVFLAAHPLNADAVMLQRLVQAALDRQLPMPSAPMPKAMAPRRRHRYALVWLILLAAAGALYSCWKLIELLMR